MGIVKLTCLQGECQPSALSLPEIGVGGELGCPCAHKRNTEGLSEDGRTKLTCNKEDKGHGKGLLSLLMVGHNTERCLFTPAKKV